MMHEFRLPACENTASLTNPDGCDIHEAVRFVHSCIFFFTENLGCLVHSVFDSFYFCFLMLQEVWTLCRIFQREAPFNKKYLSSKQQCVSTDSSASPCESDNLRHNDESFEVSANNKVIESQATNDHFYGNNNQSFAAQMSLTSQVPFTTSYLSFLNQNGDQLFGDDNWDELRPMVEFALDPSEIYCIR
jgi:hypothetical protein